MIRTKCTYREMEALYDYMKTCLTGDIRTADGVKEYFLAFSLRQLQVRIAKKMTGLYHDNSGTTGTTKKHTLKINNDELLALSIFFARVNVYPFLLPLQTSILNQMPTELIQAQCTK